MLCFFFFSSRRRHTRLQGDWSSDVCSSDLAQQQATLVSMVEREHAGTDRLAGDDPKLVGLAGWERREIVCVEETTAPAPLHKKHGGGPPRPVGPAQRCHLCGGGGQGADEIVAS